MYRVDWNGNGYTARPVHHRRNRWEAVRRHQYPATLDAQRFQEQFDAIHARPDRNRRCGEVLSKLPFQSVDERATPEDAPANHLSDIGHDTSGHVVIIVDGYHVDFTTIRVALNAKPAGKVFLVTDAMPPVGGSGIGYMLGSHEIFVSAGKCATADGVLAGSTLDMATAVRNVIQECGIPKDEALRMASLYPANYLGISDQYGRITPGVVANMAIFDNEIRIAGVVASREYEAFSRPSTLL